ncbi:SusD/RagB family nutrient-binding outer membrane lipoprotein [Zunongwangia endophytica]|uniref:SusD/RagB family nutrient-binding outer membrane lipoprotein n=1 Tax=Zunongwangia endophytica TaxID=1808945 RepID=A0ABV8H4P8_9FLAO|nr:SusD/RagB family nutrient-binding outer membrane lipoprotein [Zunongwangia endophytica]MDN3595426.1 SusD/RagB family nutrient-binding outer membrane lipoprotein [Zunongwangia endophytica]
MKNRIYTLMLLIGALSFQSCDEDFEELNVDPTKTTEMDLSYKFPSAVLYVSGQRYESWRANLIYSSTMIQHIANTETYWSGDKYLLNTAYAEAFWTAMYPQAIKSIEDMKYGLEQMGDSTSVDYAIVNTLGVYQYQKITDLYGDVPYSEAGKAFIDGDFRPAYDPQEDIYADMLNKLEASAAIFEAGGTSTLGSADILFGGDVNKWRKWANSLMLRLAMRMTKVDESAAQEWAQKAIEGGVMESNDDIAYVVHEEGNGIVQNGNGETFTADGTPRMSDTFIEFLQDDPRLTIYSSLPENTGEEDADGNAILRSDEERLDPDAQIGLPNGLDGTLLRELTGETDTQDYSEPNRLYMTSEAAPMFFQTYAEVEFMLAEAAFRWGIAGGDAEAHYNAGVRAAMNYLELYSPNAAISEAEIDEYLEDNAYAEEDALEQINTQYWAATFLNEIESYSNWRRSGFPDLTPVNYPGNVTNGTIPRRLTYMTSEQSTNAENYNAAVQSQGPDLLTTRIWWDVE